MTIQSLRGEAPFIHGMFWSDEGCSLFGFPILTFARLESLALVSPTMDTFDPGTEVTVWGSRKKDRARPAPRGAGLGFCDFKRPTTIRWRLR